MLSVSTDHRLITFRKRTEGQIKEIGGKLDKKKVEVRTAWLGMCMNFDFLSHPSRSLQKFRDQFSSWIKRPRDPLSPPNCDRGSRDRIAIFPPPVEAETGDSLIPNARFGPDAATRAPVASWLCTTFTRVDVVTEKLALQIID